MDLDFLNAPLSPPGSMSGRELDAALDQIVTMAERNQFAQAGHAAAQLWKEHIYDARTIGVLLFAAFSEKGMAALGDIFAAAQSILTVHWPMIGPEPNRNRHADSSLRWLATSIISHFRFSQKLNPSEWQKLLRDWEGANQGLAFTQLAQLLSSCEMPLPMGQAKASLSQLLKVLRELPTTRPDPKPASTPAQNAAPDQQSTASPGEAAADIPALFSAEFANMKPQDQSTESSGQTAGAGTKAVSATISGTPSQPTLVIPLSPPMLALLKKLGAFNRLVRLGRFKQAAIVYKDIKENIEKFDPRLYLPSVFGEYFSNIVTHAEKLLPSLDTQDDFAHRALLDLYRIDLELFIQATC